MLPTVRRTLTLSALACLGLLTGCATDRCCTAVTEQVCPVSPCAAQMMSSNAQMLQQRQLSLAGSAGLPGATGATSVKRLLAVGYGNAGAYSQYNPGQRTLMAMRAAQVDAYRNMAEQVYGFRVWGRTSVSAFATQSDATRTYVDAFIRGARVVHTTAIGDGNYEATVELEVSQRFIDGLIGQESNLKTSHPGCAGGGCVGSSIGYVSN